MIASSQLQIWIFVLSRMVPFRTENCWRYRAYLYTRRRVAPPVRVVAAGIPREIITEELISAVFDLACRIIPDPVTGTPLCIPIGRPRAE